MAHLCAGGSAGDGRAAGVGKEVEHFDRPSRLLDLLAGKVPVDRLFGEKPRVLEVHGLDLECEVLILHLPRFGQLVLVPMTAAGGRAVVAALCALPAAVLVGRVPDRLRVGAHQYLLIPPLQLFAVAAVEQFIVFPSVRDPHGQSSRVGFCRITAP